MIVSGIRDFLMVLNIKKIGNFSSSKRRPLGDSSRKILKKTNNPRIPEKKQFSKRVRAQEEVSIQGEGRVNRNPIQYISQ